MNILIHDHALARMKERGASQEDVKNTILTGEQFPAKYGRQGYWKEFQVLGYWQEKFFSRKRVEVFVVEEKDSIVVVTVIVKYF